MARVECPGCGTEQEAAEAADARCVICGRPLADGPSGARARGAALELTVPSSSAAEVFDVEEAPREEDRLAPLKKGAGARPAELDELLAAEKRTTSLLAVVPLWGPWRIWRSEAHDQLEKMLLTLVSAAVTVAIVVGVWATRPGEAERASLAAGRIAADTDALVAIVERYRREYRDLPEPKVWQDSVRRRDRRFFDPWGRAYRYERRGDGFAIGTYGADGEPGGEGEDRDVVREFR